VSAQRHQDGLWSLTAHGAALWLHASGALPPQLVHLGAPAARPDALILDRPLPASVIDAATRRPLLPDPALGWGGLPGVDGLDSARPWAWELPEPVADGLICRYRRESGERAALTLTAFADGVFRWRLKVGGLVHPGMRVCYTVPLPEAATEALTFGGFWAGELAAGRAPLAGGLARVNRAGSRSAHDAFPGLVVGTPGFAEDAGEVLGLHLAWPGNCQWLVLPTRDGGQVCQLLLDPAELATDGDELLLPPLYLGWSDAGLNGLRCRMQDAARHLRRQTGAAAAARLQLNTWEGVYFDHQPARLAALADAAADVGAERFVLDDGWFGRRRDDRRGLGDWMPRPEVYPDGLGALIDHVESRGLEFGLWVEPEMVNADSALFEAHPDWILGQPEQPLGRHQYALDLCRQDCFEHLAGTITALLDDPRIVSLKWDCNRDVPQAAGRPLIPAFRRLIEAVQTARSGGVEIEACASGGGRADLSALEWCNRVWLSDAHDPDLRLAMLASYGLFAPPEVMGSHIGPGRSHQTGRRFSLHARASMAVLGSMGLELDLPALSDAELDTVRGYVSLHKAHRHWLHDGHLLVVPAPDPGLLAVGVFGRDRHRALICLLQCRPRQRAVPGALRIAHLSGSLAVRTPLLDPAVAHGGPQQPAWLGAGAPAVVDAAILEASGLPLPLLPPMRALLLLFEPASGSSG